MKDATFLTPPEIAKRFGITGEKVRNWIRTGQLRAVDLSDSERRPRFRITEDDLALFLDSRANARPTEPAPRHRRRVESNVKAFF